MQNFTRYILKMKKKFNKINNPNYIFIFSTILYILLIVSNRFPEINYTIEHGFPDQLQYYKIFIFSPDFSTERISTNQAQRFFFPYIIGLLAHFLQIKKYAYILFVLLNIFFNLLTIYFFLKIAERINPKNNLNVILVASLIFNPYIFRSSIYAPLMISDHIFIYGYLLVAFYFLEKKNIFFYIGIILCCLSRQTSIILCIIFFVIIIHNILFKKKFNIKLLIFGILINILLFFITSNIASNFSMVSFYKMSDSITGLFLDKYNFSQLLTFFIQLILSNFIIFNLLFLIILYFNSYKKRINFNLIVIFILSISLWSQPMLGGPSYTGGNISRLTMLSFPVFLIFLLLIFRNFKINLFYTGIIIFLLFMSSMHHHYSFFGYLFKFKNYHFFVLNVFVHALIFWILKKQKVNFYSKKIYN